MDDMILDRNKSITEIIWVGGGKIYTIPEHNSYKWCLELWVPGHHSAGTEMTPNTERKRNWEMQRLSCSGFEPMPATLTR